MAEGGLNKQTDSHTLAAAPLAYLTHK